MDGIDKREDPGPLGICFSHFGEFNERLAVVDGAGQLHGAPTGLPERNSSWISFERFSTTV